MKFTIKQTQQDIEQGDCAIVAVFNNRLSPSAKYLDRKSKGHLKMALASGDLGDKKGSTLLVHASANINPKRVLLLQCGDGDALSAAEFRSTIQSAVSALSKTQSKNIVFCLQDIKTKKYSMEQKLQCAVQAFHYQAYQYAPPYALKKSAATGKNANTLKKVVFISTSSSKKGLLQAIKNGNAIATGITLTRELSNLPANICTPTYLATQAKQLARKHSKLKITVHNEAAIEKMGMGSFLSVSRGSIQPAKLITMQYNGGKKGDQPIVLVGKGVTFDTGGISIKPAAAMDEMKYDMCGAASVFGTLHAIAEMNLALNVIGVVPTTENMPNGDATKPGDVVTSMAGLTIEVLNTDAEGRLILCDALTYSKRFKPAAVIDIATLTGACVVALGHHTSGLMANDQDLADDILAAGETSGDHIWQLPLGDDYDKQLDSNFADMANIGGRYAGTITAGCFLARFAQDFDWAHLDIAGTAWHSGANKGATGRPVELLTQYLMTHAMTPASIQRKK